LFHLLVPGGKWLTVISKLKSVAIFWSSIFQNVGVSKDTAQFAVSTIRNWWEQMGKESYPDSKKLLIHADGGGSNGSRNRLWKKELQKMATAFNLEITVSHFPPGTSKWNKIEHRLFSQITKNWRGKPLESLTVIVSLIGATSTKTGLKVEASLDTDTYEGGIKVLDKEMKTRSRAIMPTKPAYK